MVGRIDVGDQEMVTAFIPGESVRSRTDREPAQYLQLLRVDDEDLAATSSGREHHASAGREQHAAALRAALDGSRRFQAQSIDHFDGVEGGVSYEDASCDRVDIAMIERSGQAGWDTHRGEELEPCAQPCRATSCRHHAYSASYIGVSRRIFSWSLSPCTIAKPWAMA